MSGKTILVWFRNDLRIHDNEIFLEAANRGDFIIPVYCFDPRYFRETKFGTKKTGVFRAQFLIESVQNLRNSLRRLGGGLMVKRGKPEEILPEICMRYKVSEVYHHREVAPEETLVSSLVEDALWKLRINLKHFVGHTMYHKQDLPFSIKSIPDNFVSFRKKVERDSLVRPCFATPRRIAVPHGMSEEPLPELSDLGIEMPAEAGIRFSFKGGEDEGLKHLRTFLKGVAAGEGNVSGAASSRLSPWLSMGCISPREVYREVMKHKKHQPALCARIVTELQWRDYFRFMLKKHGSLTSGGPPPEKELSALQRMKFLKWAQGQTGEAVIDACMHELNATGYLTDVCRQYAATFLVNELEIPWSAGAAYFEEKAIDFSPASNWGNWAYVMGHGIMSANRPATIRYSDIASEEGVQSRLRCLKNA